VTVRTKILIVEDEPLIRMHLAYSLGDLGFEILEAANADEAIALLESDADIMAVLTDVDMPGTMDGLALARAVRERWPPCKLIILSGHMRPSPDHVPQGSRYIRKPVDTKELLRTLTELGVGS
jgi:CheY-like chemotaxis protein